LPLSLPFFLGAFSALEWTANLCTFWLANTKFRANFDNFVHRHSKFCFAAFSPAAIRRVFAFLN